MIKVASKNKLLCTYINEYNKSLNNNNNYFMIILQYFNK